MGSGIPLLNEYKQVFFLKRLPQTILGGPKLKLGYDAPIYVYLNQVLLFIIPFVLGGIFTLLVELDTMNDYVGVIVYGCLIFIFVLIIQITTTVVHIQSSSEIPLPTKKNLLNEDDEVDFFSCCGVETFEFVLPRKKFSANIAIHSVLSGVMCGLTLWYLLPSTLSSLYSSNTGATVVLYILGWVTLCIAQYPLTVSAPPEPATFMTMDRWELSPLFRPFYVLVCVAFDLLYRYHSTDFLTTDQVLHIVFVCLPILWTTGLLPPLDAFFFWLLEQMHIFLFGGSTMASGLRLCIYLLLSLGVYFFCYFISSGLAAVIVAACCGYVLSLDLGGLGTQIYKYCVTRNKVSTGNGIPSPAHKPKFLWRWGVLECIYHLLVVACVGVVSGLLNKNVSDLSTDTWKYLGYTIIGLCIAEKILRDIQSVYIFFGLWRNMLFPSTAIRTSMFKSRKRMLKPIGVIRRIIVNWVGPMIMLSYLSILVVSSDPTSVSLTSTRDTYTSVWYIFGVVRVFRWIWQGTLNSFLELSITHIILVTMDTDSTVVKFGAPVLSLIIGISRDRFFQLMNKLFFGFSLLISSWTDKKQRRGSTAAVMLLSLIFFPVIFGVMAIAAALSAPLLPLFTLPVFFIAFPRPNKFWPESVGASANVCPDTMFYRQFAPKFAEALSTAFADGSLGEAVPGNHYLVRFQDRLVWVMILERGYGFCSVSIKGLELQETSCHTTEAARLDDIFEEAFEQENGFVLGSLNHYPLHALTPVDAATVHTYSDARNVLTGIIDSPSSLQLTMSLFAKSLVWVLLHHVNKLKMDENRKGSNSVISEDSTSDGQNKDKLELEEINHNQQTRNNNVSNRTTVPQKGGASNMVVMVTNPRPPPTKAVQRKSSWSSIESFTDSIWSDDGIIGNKKTKNASSNIQTNNAASKSKDFADDAGDLDDLFEDLGFPALDVTKPKQPSYPAFTPSTVNKPQGASKTRGSNGIYKPVTNLAGSPDFKCTHSVQISLPKRWRELPVEYSQLSKFLNQFPKDWYQFVLGTLDWSATGQLGEKVALDVGQDDTLMNCYAQLIMACYSIFDTQTSYNSANTLYKFYMGDLPCNAMLDWLLEDRELHGLVLKAFRYGFKMMLDQMLLGEATSHDEVQEYLEEYDRDWYIGLESEEEWKSAVLSSRPNLFSMGHNKQQGTYSSRLLTLQELITHIGRLNTEVVRGQWANLSLELLYFTNDDEERYSIQAHPTVLRNLTVQSADPPLGYPIYSSEPISVPTL